MLTKKNKRMENLRENIKQRVISLIDEWSIKEEVNEDDDLYNDLGFDDLDFMEFVIESEKEFGIHLLDEEIYDINTLKEFIDLILKCLKNECIIII